MSHNRQLLFVWLWPFFSSLGLDEPARGESPAQCAIRIVDVTDRTGISFRHTDGGSGNRFIVESVVAGLALFDFDGDGLTDIYFLNGAPLPGTVVAHTPTNKLYRNNGDWTFTDVTDAAEVGDAGYGLGVTVADYDADGDDDLYLNNFGPNVLYLNNGDGTFTNVARQRLLDEHGAPDRSDRFGAGACFFDMDGDGDLDLYSANYVEFSFDKHKIRMIGEYQFHPGPKDYPATPDDLYRNNGDGTFSNVAGAAGIAAHPSRGMGTLAFDYDNDGDTDVFVCNDSGPNLLHENDGRGRFREVGIAAGIAYDLRGREHANMGVDCGDFDNDGLLDLFVTSFSNEPPLLLRNLGTGLFEDATNRAGAGSAVFAHANWGTAFADFDLDGDQDLFIANGHFMDNIRHIDQRTSVKVQNTLLMNRGNGQFIDVSNSCGDGLKVVESSRGAGVADLDNDGDPDIVVLNANGPPTILRNESPRGPAWLQIQLLGFTSNRPGIGARVEVRIGTHVHVQEVHAGRGYQSHFGGLHFGLGDTKVIDQIRVRWPNGSISERFQVPVNQVLRVFEVLPADR